MSVGTYAELFAVGIAIFAIIISVITFKKSSSFTAYSDLDVLYQNILKEGLIYPQFRTYRNTDHYKKSFENNEKELGSYNAYATLCMNLAETVYDRVIDNEKFWKSWKPMIQSECDLHKSWFFWHTQFYKKEFVDYIITILPEYWKNLKQIGTINEKVYLEKKSFC